MKKINVIVKEKTLLELKEDAKAGDIIDLQELAEVDSRYIEEIIDSGKDKVYEAKLEQFRKTLEAENQVNIGKLLAEIDALKKDNANALLIKEKDIEKQYSDRINSLKREIENNKLNNNIEIERIKKEDALKYASLEKEYNVFVAKHDSELKQSKTELESANEKKIVELKASYEKEIVSKVNELDKAKLVLEGEKEKALVEQKEAFEQRLKEKELEIDNLKRAKSSMNVKQTGEDLEAWCDNEVTSYMQNGLFNCDWKKDNKVIKNDDEVKGSKADYIFKIYVDEKKEENDLLASVCLDMKDENPGSVNKKNNDDYYGQLDKNREKKNCKYAVLVSNLEMDKPNILPIFKVREYENMYVVRPAYLMVFLNMLTSLTTRFANILKSQEKEMIELKEKDAILNEFESIKITYLDKPLDTLRKSVEEITKNSEAIRKASNSIDEQCEKINKSYINQIEEKISKFELNLTKTYRKIDKLK